MDPSNRHPICETCHNPLTIKSAAGTTTRAVLHTFWTCTSCCRFGRNELWISPPPRFRHLTGSLPAETAALMYGVEAPLNDNPERFVALRSSTRASWRPRTMPQYTAAGWRYPVAQEQCADEASGDADSAVESDVVHPNEVPPHIARFERESESTSEDDRDEPPPFLFQDLETLIDGAQETPPPMFRDLESIPVSEIYDLATSDRESTSEDFVEQEEGGELSEEIPDLSSSSSSDEDSDDDSSIQANSSFNTHLLSWIEFKIAFLNYKFECCARCRGQSCPVCYENFDDEITTPIHIPCTGKHVICRTCANNWFCAKQEDKQMTNACPMCRQKLFHFDSVERIYGINADADDSGYEAGDEEWSDVENESGEEVEDEEQGEERRDIHATSQSWTRYLELPDSALPEISAEEYWRLASLEPSADLAGLGDVDDSGDRTNQVREGGGRGGITRIWRWLWRMLLWP